MSPATWPNYRASIGSWLENEKYVAVRPDTHGVVRSKIFPGLVLDMNALKTYVPHIAVSIGRIAQHRSWVDFVSHHPAGAGPGRFAIWWQVPRPREFRPPDPRPVCDPHLCQSRTFRCAGYISVQVCRFREDFPGCKLQVESCKWVESGLPQGKPTCNFQPATCNSSLHGMLGSGYAGLRTDPPYPTGEVDGRGIVQRNPYDSV